MSSYALVSTWISLSLSYRLASCFFLLFHGCFGTARQWTCGKINCCHQAQKNWSLPYRYCYICYSWQCCTLKGYSKRQRLRNWWLPWQTLHKHIPRHLLNTQHQSGKIALYTHNHKDLCQIHIWQEKSNDRIDQFTDRALLNSHKCQTNYDTYSHICRIAMAIKSWNSCNEAFLSCNPPGS